MPTYRQIFWKSVKIVKVPSLWFFALLAAVLGAGGSLEYIYQSTGLGSQATPLEDFFAGLIEGGFFNPQTLLTLTKTMVTAPLFFIQLLLVYTILIALVILTLWLIIVSQGAIIFAISNLIKGKKQGWINSFKVGVKNFWPVFLADVVIIAFMMFLRYLLALLAIFESFWPFGIGLIIFSLVVFVVSLIGRFLIFFVVLKDEKIIKALNSSIELFKKHWALSLEVALVVFIVYRIINFIFVTVISEFIYYIFFRSPALLDNLLQVSFIIFIILQIILTIFFWSVWTIVFEIIANKNLDMTSRFAGGVKRIFKRS